ncbi:MAG TPA: branched-chain amino acid ABC transporter permease [Roseomonas sp.]|nr:branched-chain amino acid ABC transporter permease [Roseomonas sp.]
MIEALIQALINGVIAGTILAVPALGFTAIFAVLNYPNFAIGALATVGAYAGWVGNTVFGLPMVAALPLAFAVAALAGLALQWAAVKPLESAGALMMAIASLAAGLVIENMLRFGFGNDLRGFDLPLLRDWRFGEFRIGPQQVQNFGLALACMALLWAFLRFSRTGRAMRAVADNRDLALLRGVDPARVAAVTVAVGAGLAGMGGMLVGLDTSVDPLTGTRLVLSIFAAAVLGGLGSIPGAVTGAIAIGLAEEVAVLAFSPAYRLVVGFVVILIVLTLRPAGFFGARAS